jgi:hypothetical protein
MLRSQRQISRRRRTRWRVYKGKQGSAETQHFFASLILFLLSSLFLPLLPRKLLLHDSLTMLSNILQTVILSLILRNTLAAPVEVDVPSTNGTGTYERSLNARDGGSSPPKLVVAHMMVGNTYSYSVDTWASDIKLASANGIDGFALNIGSAASFTDTQVANACVSDFS